MIVIGSSEAKNRAFFADVRQAGLVTHPYAMPYESGLPIWICRNPKLDVRQVWPRVKHFD